MDIAKKTTLPNVNLFETFELKIPGPWPLELSNSVVSWQNPVQIHHCHGLFLNVTGHSSRSPANFAMAPVPDNLSALPPYGSSICFNAKRAPMTWGDLGYPDFRNPLALSNMVIQDSKWFTLMFKKHQIPWTAKEGTNYQNSYHILHPTGGETLATSAASSAAELQGSQDLWAIFTSNETYLWHGSITWNHPKSQYILYVHYIIQSTEYCSHM